MRRAHFVGAILNRVDLDRNGYYYSQYYRSDYNQVLHLGKRLIGGLASHRPFLNMWMTANRRTGLVRQEESVE